MNRASRAIGKMHGKVWMFSNGIFFKTSHGQAETLVAQDKKTVEGDLEKTRQRIKENVIVLEEQERGVAEARTRGFELQGMSK